MLEKRRATTSFKAKEVKSIILVKDDVLVSRAQAGNEQAFTELVKDYHAFVYAIVSGVLDDLRDTEEVVQDTFINAYRGLAQLENPARFKGWLAEIARNCARDRLRKKKPENVPIDEVRSPSLETSDSADARLIQDEQRELVRRAMMTLSQKDREIARAYYLDGASYDELIRVHGLSYKAISFRLSRAKQKLSERLKHLRTGATTFPTTAVKGSESRGFSTVQIAPMKHLQDNAGQLVAFFPDGKNLAGLNTDNSLKAWDIEYGSKFRTVERVTGHGETISLFRGRTLKVSPEGRFSVISSTFDSTGSEIVTLWDGESKSSFRHETVVVAAALSPDARLLATGGWDETVTLWSVETRKRIRVLSGHKGEIHALAFSSDGRLLASSGAYKWKYLECEDGSTLRRNGPCAIRGDGTGSLYFYASDDSQTDTTAKVWEVNSGRNVATLEHQEIVTEIVFSPDGTRVATASGNKVNTWCTETWKAVKTLDTVEVESIAYSPDGTRLAIGGTSENPMIQICSTDTGQLIAELTGHTSRVESVAFSPDGRLLASGGFDNAIFLWGVETGK